MDAISEAAARGATTPCVCPTPGFCARHGIDKPQRLWELCRVDIRYFNLWESGDSPQHRLRAAERATAGAGAVQPAGLAPVERLPCIYRGAQISTIGCGGCGGATTPVYACRKHDECTVDRVASGVTFCGQCRDREAPPMPANNGAAVDPVPTVPGAPTAVLGNGEQHAPPAGFVPARPASHPAAAERLVIHDGLCPGDIAVLTAAVKALHDQYPGRFLTDVRTPCPALWEHNPLVTSIPDTEGKRVPACYDADRAYPGRAVYATVNACNHRPIHMLEAYCEGLAAALDLPRLTPANWLEPSIFLSAQEKSWTSQVQEITGKPTRFWIVNSGIKLDYTAKRWNGFQEVVDRTKHRVTWVQIGSPEHQHRPMQGVIDLLGKTDLRQLVRLVYHAEGVLCGVTALMHLAHWIERGPSNPFRRHAVVVAGGREPPHWSAYPGQHIFHTIGEFDCCAAGGCWKSRVEPQRESPDKNNSLCVHPRGDQGLCMESIQPRDVARMVLRLCQ